MLDLIPSRKAPFSEAALLLAKKRFALLVFAIFYEPFHPLVGAQENPRHEPRAIYRSFQSGRGA